MKNQILLAAMSLCFIGKAQVGVGTSVPYGGISNAQTKFRNINPIHQTNGNELEINISGIYNEVGSSYTAIFSMQQIAGTSEDATKIMDNRIAQIQQQLKLYDATIELKTDVISFVPIYEFDVTKKMFNPKTYNERPTGFEIKKNLHIKFTTSEQIDKIMKICSDAEVYDLATIEYNNKNLEKILAELQAKALEKYQSQLQLYGKILNIDFQTKEKKLNEGWEIIYPNESYRNYQAFVQGSTNFSKHAEINEVKKTTTYFFDPKRPNQESFVIHPEIAEPVIQILYKLSVTIKIKEDEKPKPAEKEYHIITPQGEIKKLEL